MRLVITSLFVYIISLSSACAAVLGAGDLAWEPFFEDNSRTMKYNRESLDQNIRTYQARIWLYTKFKQPLIRQETDGVPVKYIFQHVIFDCMSKRYTQTEMLVFDWENEANVGHIMSSEEYGVTILSPMDKLFGIACAFIKKLNTSSHCKPLCLPAIQSDGFVRQQYSAEQTKTNRHSLEPGQLNSFYEPTF
jgi:hypothetical protein